MNCYPRSKIKRYKVLKIAALILILGSFYMAERYKKIIFSSFDKGSEFDFHEEGGFKTSDGIIIDDKTKKPKLLKDTAIEDIAGMEIVCEYSMQEYNGDLYVFVADQATGISKIYISTGGTGALTLYKDLGAGNGSPAHLFIAQGKLYAKTDTHKLYVHDWGASNFVYVSLLGPRSIGRCVDLEEWSYYTVGDSIYRTKDGFLTAEAIGPAPQGFEIEFMAAFQGYIYFQIKNDFVRMDKNGKTEVIRNFPNIPRFKKSSQSTLFIFVSDGKKIDIFAFDGYQIKKIKKINAYENVWPLSFDGELLYFYAIYSSIIGNQIYHFYGINEDGHIFRFQNFLKTEDGLASDVVKIKDKLIYNGSKPTSPWNARISRETANYVISGGIETGIINKTKIIPIAAIIRNKPLGAGTSIKLYAKKDQSSTWGTALMTSDTAGAVEKQYDFPNTYGKVTFLELRIELLTTDTTKTPEDVEIVFIYSEVGIESSL